MIVTRFSNWPDEELRRRALDGNNEIERELARRLTLRSEPRKTIEAPLKMRRQLAFREMLAEQETVRLIKRVKRPPGDTT